MKIFETTDSEGRLVAFEISNYWLGRRAACRIVKSLPGVRMHRESNGHFWESEEDFCQFELGGARFTIWEPWNDSSRYRIHPVEPGPYTELVLIRDAFARSTLLGRVLRAAG